MENEKRLKNLSASIGRNGRKQRTFRTIIFALFVFVSLSGFAQITLNVKNLSLRASLKRIEQVSNYKFFYNENLSELEQTVALNVKNASLDATMRQLLAKMDLSYKVESGNVVVLVRKPQQPAQTFRDQKKTLRGKVVDEKGQPIIGASVKVQGTDMGAITDLNGNYTLSNVPDNGTILVSFIGYSTVSLSSKSKALSHIILKEDATALSEVVVVGYGVQRKRDVSTSISQVKAEEIANLPVSDFRQSLVGKMPGVSVMQPSGDPEGSVTVRVRGVSSATAGNDPLYIIDGVPVDQGLLNLNTNDIESVEVLKDASSAAIYGSRGSNGVVLITTKKGKTDKLTVSYDGYYAFDKVSKKIDLMNAYQYAEVSKEAHDACYYDIYPNGTAANGSRPKTYMNYPTDFEPYLKGEKGLTDTDWQDAIFRTAQSQSHNLSFSGKTGNNSYFISASYLSKEGVIIHSDYKKYSVRLNFDGKYKKLKYGVNFSPSYSKSNRVDASGSYSNEGVVQTALAYCPIWPVYNEDGSFNYQGNGYWRLGTDYQHNEMLNPVALATLKSDVVDRVGLVGKVYAGIDLMKGLNYTISLGGNYYGSHNDQYRAKELPLAGKAYYDSPSPGTGYSSSGFYYNWLLENQFTYHTTINKDHAITAIFVQSAQKEVYKGDNVTATNYPNDNIQTISAGTVSEGASSKSEWSLASYLARVQYSYQGKYMLSAAIRADGSSRFGKNNRWGYFPSASAAWRISAEPFFQETRWLRGVTDMKIRASYGQTGNFQIGNYQHLSTMAADNYILGTNGGILAYGYKPTRVDNPNLTWEKTAMMNVGVDLNLWNGYLGVTAEYYNSNTTDMLLQVPVSYLTGMGTTLMNVGKVNNHGYEFTLTSQHEYKNGFGYSFNANYSKNINEVKSLGATDTPIISTGSVDHAYYITEIGKPIGSYYLLVKEGVFENEEQLNAYPHFSNTKVGDFRYKDVDGDKVMDLDKDRTIVGNYMPDFTYSFGGTAHYKGLDFSIQFQGVYGNEILNLNRRYIDNLEGNLNGMTESLNRWRSAENIGNGQVNRANRKQTGYNGRTSTWHVEDGSYLRLQNVSLGYTLPSAWTKKFYVRKLRIYFSGQNLVTWTKYSGYNPEVSIRPNSALTQGEDYGTYPLSKTYMVGLNITF